MADRRGVEGFGARLAQARRVHGVRVGRDYSQSDLARALDVTPQTVSRWEGGISLPDIPTALRIAEILKADDPAYLVLGIKKIEGNPKEVPPGTPNSIPVIGEVVSPETRRGRDDLATHERSHQVAARRKKGKARRKRA